MLNGKRVQNFITYQTKQTIYLHKNLPQLIVHEEKFESDSIKQLLSKRSQKCKSSSRNHKKQNKFFEQSTNFKQQTKKNKRQNQQTVNQRKLNKVRSNQSQSKSKSNSKSKNNHLNKQNIGECQNLQKNKLINNQVEDQTNYQTKRTKINKKYTLDNLKSQQKQTKSKSKNKNCKSMIKLPSYDKNILNIQNIKKVSRKSYSPNRNHSQKMKKTVSVINLANQQIKTSKFTTQIKEKVLKRNKKETQIKKMKQKAQIMKKQTKSSNVNIFCDKNRIKVSSLSKKNQIRNQIKPKYDTITSKVTSPSKAKHLSSTTNLLQKQKTSNRKPLKQKKLKQQKRNFQSVNDQFLKHQQQNGVIALDKYLSHRDSLGKKVKTDRDSFKRTSLTKLNQIKTIKARHYQDQYHDYNWKNIQENAAIKIQKLYKGYITRKWLTKYLKIINAAVIIQKTYRGYRERKNIKNKLKELKLPNPIENLSKNCSNDLIHQNQLSSTNNQLLDKWKDILVQVMGQKTVNENLKSKIKCFLQSEEISGRSSITSKRSRNSSQKVKDQILSEKRFFLKQSSKKQPQFIKKSFDQVLSINPTFQLDQYKNKIITPKGKQAYKEECSIKQLTFSPKLQKVKMSPTIRKKDGKFEQKDNKKIVQMVKSPLSQQKLGKQQSEQMINQKKQQSISLQQLKSCPLQNYQYKQKPSNENYLLQQKEQNQPPYYQQFTTFNINHIIQTKSQASIHTKTIRKIDNSEEFIDQYLLTFIQFIRTKDQGQEISQVVNKIKKYSNLDAQIILKNLSLVNQNDNKDDAFSLPLYKYLDIDDQIFKQEHIRQFNKQFIYILNNDVLNNSNSSTSNHKNILISPASNDCVLQNNDLKAMQLLKEQSTQAIQVYLKMLTDCLNQALNLKRPSHYMFIKNSIQSKNTQLLAIRQLQNIQSSYEYYCGLSMQDLFYWKKVKHGYGVDKRNAYIKNNFDQNLQDQEIQHSCPLTIEEITQFNKRSIQKILKMEVQKKQNDYCEIIQIIAILSSQIFQELIITEIQQIFFNLENIHHLHNLEQNQQQSINDEFDEPQQVFLYENDFIIPYQEQKSIIQKRTIDNFKSERRQSL